MLNTVVSWCHGAFDVNTTRTTLADWLQKVDENGPDYWQKKKADALMPHGEFFGRRTSMFARHSGYIQVDIDAKDNPDMNAEQLRDLLGEDSHCAFSQLSYSLQGVWALFAVGTIDAMTHAAAASHVVAYVEDRFNVKCDTKVSRNLASLRFRSSDPDFTVNPTATPFKYDF